MFKAGGKRGNLLMFFYLKNMVLDWSYVGLIATV